MSKSVAELQAELDAAQARERTEKQAAAEAEKTKQRRAAQKAELQRELDNRLLQIENTLKWVDERKTDAGELKSRIEAEFGDV